MTVGTKLQQTIASAEGVAANLKTFAQDTQDQTMKQQYQNLAQSMDMIVDQLNARWQQVQQEEPQYTQQ